MKEKDIFISACGEDELGFAKAMIKIENSIIAENKDPAIVDEIILDNPVVNMFRSRAFTMIDLTFKDIHDDEFIKTAELLKSFCTVENSLDSSFVEMPSICITVCPKEFGGEYYIVGIHAMWCIQPSSIGNNIDTLRFIISNEFLHTYRYDISQIDIDKLSEDEAERT